MRFRTMSLLSAMILWIVVIAAGLVRPEGSEARRFGATTSGYALLDDSGGITGARGQAGSSSGSEAILTLFR